MFLEAPSRRTMIEGFMEKEGRTLEEFKALSGFNNSELTYEYIQACLLIYHDEFNGVTACKVDSNDNAVFIEYLDENNASIRITVNNGDIIEIGLNYRVDNFPVFNILYNGERLKDTRFLYRTNISTYSNITMIGVLSETMPWLLWTVYQKRMRDKK